MHDASTNATEPTDARHVMTAPVIQVAPETGVQEAIRLLRDHRIGAVPVVDAEGTLQGLASEGDLLPPVSRAGQADAVLTDAGRTVRDVMHTPVVTITEDTTVQEAARLLRTHSIKQLPVLRDGRLVGIVASPDLLRVVERMPMDHHAAPPLAQWGEMIASFFGGSGGATGAAAAAAPDTTSSEPSTAAAFRDLVERSDQDRIDERTEARHAADLARLEQVKTMLHEHVGEGMWTTLMAHARATAAHGGKEIQMLRFPAALCSDGGRKINNADPSWTGTLRGEAAELYARYEQELKPAGFNMAARVADYPNGMPGDVALFLVWLN